MKSLPALMAFVSWLISYGPRGKKKADLRLDAWAKNISPSTELRKWFDHDSTHWLEFCKRYKAELKSPEMKDAIAQMVHAAQKHIPR
jgi:uncharacterized protein YeaO (DUF488 family)